jgi:hypothetical protein
VEERISFALGAFSISQIFARNTVKKKVRLKTLLIILRNNGFVFITQKDIKSFSHHQLTSGNNKNMFKRKFDKK